MFLVCGEALYDVFIDREGAGGFTLDARLGGSAFNCAIGVARLGAPVGLLTGVSTDPLGAKIVRALADEGVETRFLARSDKPSTLALVALGTDRGAHYTFYGEGAADRAVRPSDLPALDGIDGVVFGCFSILTEPTGSSFLRFAERAAGGPLVALDPNVRTTVEPDLDRWRARVDAFAAHADLVKVSAEDLRALYPTRSNEAAAASWLGKGVRLVVVTDGAVGATAWWSGGRTTVPAAKATVVDTVGAGDSFLAALLAGLDEHALADRDALAAGAEADVRALLGFAAAAAAVTCSRRGADLPRRTDLMRD